MAGVNMARNSMRQTIIGIAGGLLAGLVTPENARPSVIVALLAVIAVLIAFDILQKRRLRRELQQASAEFQRMIVPLVAATAAELQRHHEEAAPWAN